MLNFFNEVLANMRIKQISLEMENRMLEKKFNQLKMSNDQLMLERLMGCLEYFAIRQNQVGIEDKKLLNRIIIAGRLVVSVITRSRVK